MIAKTLGAFHDPRAYAFGSGTVNPSTQFVRGRSEYFAKTFQRIRREIYVRRKVFAIMSATPVPHSARRVICRTRQSVQSQRCKDAKAGTPGLVRGSRSVAVGSAPQRVVDEGVVDVVRADAVVAGQAGREGALGDEALVKRTPFALGQVVGAEASRQHPEPVVVSL